MQLSSTFTKTTGFTLRRITELCKTMIPVFASLLLTSINAFGQTISAPSSPALPATICAGTNLSVAFSTTGTFNGGNQFQVQLSNATGSFLSGTVIIGTGTSSPVSCLVRIGTAAGSLYRIRVLGTAPSTIGSGSSAGTPITVRSKPTSPSTTANSRCGTGTLILGSTGCTSTRWYVAAEGGTNIGISASFTTPPIAATTNYFATCVDGNGCESVRTSTTATVNPAATITSFAPTSGIIDQDNITITGTNLSGITDVKFNGVSTTFTDNTATSVIALVPIGSTTGTISVTTSCGTFSSVSSFTVIKPTIATPVIGQPAGTYNVGFFTTLSTSTPGALIYYTTNGNTPSPGTGFTKLYQDEPIFIPTSLTLRAVGYRNGWSTSGLAIAAYTVTNPNIVAKPTISPISGTYAGGQLVTLSCTTPESVIYFTTNGQIPVPFVNTPVKYRGPFSVIDPQVTVRAIGTRTDWADGEVAVAFYILSGGSALSPCALSPLPGNFGSPISVTITNPDPLAQIYVTRDGTDPYKLLPLSKPYVGPVAIPFSLTVKAQAFRNGFGDSPRVVGIYTITGGRKAVDNNTVDSRGNYYTEATGIYGGNPEQATSTPQFSSNLSENIEVYPNPTNGTLFVDFGSEKENVEITVVNMMGQIVKSAKTTVSSFGAAIYLEGNQSGFYLVRIKDNMGSTTSRKVLLQK